MKQLTIIFILLIFKFSFSQIKHGEAIYNVKLVEKKDNTIRKMYSEMFSVDIESLANKHTFTLLFDKENSVFYVNEIDDFNKNMINSSVAITGYTFKTWRKNNKKYIHFSLDIIPEEFIVVEQNNNNWKITEEKKLIGNYLCYKATDYEITTTPEGKEFKNLLIAWFCPQIPYSFGPLGYGGLPGLIIELQTNDAVFGLKNLNFKNDIVVEPIPKILKLTSKEFEKKMEDYFKN